MKSVSTFALALGIAIGVSGFAAATPAAAQEEVAVEEFNPGNLSDPIRQVVAPVQAAVRGAEPIDAAALRQQLDAAQASIQNDDDRFLVGQTMLELSVRMQNEGTQPAELVEMQRTALRLTIDSNRLPAAQRATYWRFLGNFALQEDNLAAAEEAFRNALQFDPNNAEAQIELARIQFEQGNTAAAFEAADAALAAATETEARWFLIPLRYAAEANDAARTARYGLAMLEAHPEAENWQRALNSYFIAARFDDQTNLDLFRLMDATGSLMGQTYAEYAQVADRRGYPAEALAALNAGVASGDLQANPTLQGEYQANADRDRAELDRVRSDASAAATGEAAMNAGSAFLSHGDTAAAIELFELARQKGGVDASTLNLRYGAALAAAGRTDEARTAFEAVTGPREPIADFWLVWLGQQAGAAAPSAG